MQWMHLHGTSQSRLAGLITAIKRSALSEASTHVRQLGLPCGGQHVVHQDGQVPPGHLVPAEVPERRLLQRQGHVPPAVCIPAAAGPRPIFSLNTMQACFCSGPAGGAARNALAPHLAPKAHTLLLHMASFCLCGMSFPYGGQSYAGRLITSHLFRQGSRGAPGAAPVAHPHVEASVHEAESQAQLRAVDHPGVT